MLDHLGRTVDYMRISLTDRCNLRCAYCMPADRVRETDFLPADSLLHTEELLRLCTITAGLGISRYKLTGGEPLLRQDLPFLIRRLLAISGIKEVTLTTNGTLLTARLEELFQAGLRSVNISLDTASRSRYLAITGTDALPAVLSAVSAACEKGFTVKLNAVVPDFYAPGELEALLELPRRYPLSLRFITRMPVGEAPPESPSAGGISPAPAAGRPAASVSDAPALRESLRALGYSLRPETRRLGNGPASYFKLEGFVGQIGFIDALHENFCASCNRIRLTADGQLKPCLYFAPALSVTDLFRTGADDTLIAEKIAQAIRQKPARHQFSRPDPSTALPRDCSPMNRIGG